MALWEHLPAPRRTRDGFTPAWNSLALFFDLASRPPADYQPTTRADARNYLDEGADPAGTPVSTFLANYWGTLSYGHLAMGLNTPRDAAGRPLIPTIEPPAGEFRTDAGVIALVRSCLAANAEAAWVAAGRLISPSGRRWIPSVVLVRRYNQHATALGGTVLSAGGREYEVSVITHLTYLLDWDATLAPAGRGRGWWLTLCHEFAHNFVEFGDLYGPDGCTGYWDLLGDNHLIGKMSEVSSVHKARIGWSTLPELSGPELRPRTLTLRPFTTTGDAVKIIPDPINNPTEYFVLEYRRSTGPEDWRPDGGLTESGLLITHLATRFGAPRTWLLREAPYFDPVYADNYDSGGTLWTGWNATDGALFQVGGQFAPETFPSSALYGPRNSGLQLEVLAKTEEQLTIALSLRCPSAVGWAVAPGDQLLPGRFSTLDPEVGGQDIFVRRGRQSALLEQRQCQWFVRWGGAPTLSDSSGLTGVNRTIAGDFDGDGLDEIFLRGADTAALLKWDGTTLVEIAETAGRIGGWALGPDNWEVAGDVDGDGRSEIVVRSPGWIGVFGLQDDGTLGLRSIQSGYVGTWNLAAGQPLRIGHFTRRDRAEVLLQDGDRFAVAGWRRDGFRLTRGSRSAPGVWSLAEIDQVQVADLDGDGLDELFLHAGDRAAVLKWVGGALTTLWLGRGTIAHRIAEGAGVPIDARVRFRAARLMPDRDGLFHLDPVGVGVLTWETDRLAVRQHNATSADGQIRWALQPSDRLAIGDFHRTGSDFIRDLAGRPSDFDHVTDLIGDLFVDTGSSTVMVGFTRPAPGPLPAGGEDQLVGCWRSDRNLLYRYEQPPLPYVPPQVLIPWEAGVIIGNLGDGGYVIIYPGGGIMPVGPWDPTLAELATKIIGAIRAPDEVELYADQLKSAGLAYVVVPQGRAPVEGLIFGSPPK